MALATWKRSFAQLPTSLWGFSPSQTTISTAMMELGQPLPQGHRAAVILQHLQAPGCIVVA